VAIGGGTGLSTLLSGLKRYARIRDEFELNHAPIPVVDITAVVTVTDDGGSSGRLRRDFEVLPPGDIRNCMVALSEDETLMAKLFQHRFSSGRGLQGHSFGNLFLTALTQITGDFARAVRLSSEVLASLGRIYPSTAQDVSLEARLANGRVVRGETRISKSKSRIVSVSLRPRKVRPLDETLEAIAQADVITLGPGSLFTSIVPNLLVQGIPEAIRDSRAIKAYFVNLMWQPGETMQFRASDHVQALYDHAGFPFLDYCVVNTRPISAALRRRYEAENAMPVETDVARLQEMGVEVLGADLLRRTNKVRHDPSVAAAITVSLAQRARRAARRASEGKRK
jgi:uncharacterized cofD-like protein